MDSVSRLEKRLSDIQSQVDRLQNGLQNLSETLRIVLSKRR